MTLKERFKYWLIELITSLYDDVEISIKATNESQPKAFSKILGSPKIGGVYILNRTFNSSDPDPFEVEDRKNYYVTVLDVKGNWIKYTPCNADGDISKHSQIAWTLRINDFKRCYREKG